MAAARVETIFVHSPSIEGNLEGNSADRKVHVILPPGYDRDTERRYPVVYFLHGFISTADEYLERVDPDAALKQFVEDGGKELIIVLPDAHTKWGGSFYASGPTVGDFEKFIAEDLVAAIDTKFRTIAERPSRGLSGHSMGGHGALRIGMKDAEVFSALFAMSPCCLSARPALTSDTQYEAMDPTTVTESDFADIAYFAYVAALSPNPHNPPFYWDLVTKDGKPDELVVARWAANAPAVFLNQYVPELKSMSAIALDAGDADFVRADVEMMQRELDRYQIPHSYEEFVGDHTNRVTERFRTRVLPFFAEHLAGPTK